MHFYVELEKTTKWQKFFAGGVLLFVCLSLFLFTIDTATFLDIAGHRMRDTVPVSD